MFSYWMFGPSEITINKFRLACLNAREKTITESNCPASNEQFLQNSGHIIFKVKREIKYKNNTERAQNEKSYFGTNLHVSIWNPRIIQVRADVTFEK